jgi:hypothetical protein
LEENKRFECDEFFAARIFIAKPMCVGIIEKINKITANLGNICKCSKNKVVMLIFGRGMKRKWKVYYSAY